MNFFLRAIQQLTATTSSTKDQKIATAVPTGVGAAHNLRHITKEDLFVLPDDMALRVDGPGSPRVYVDFGGGRQITYVGATQTIVEEVLFKLFAPPGGDATISINTSSGALNVGTAAQPGTVAIQNGAGIANITCSATGARNIEHKHSGIVEVNPTVVYVSNAFLISVSYELKLGNSPWGAYNIDNTTTAATLEIEFPTNPEGGWRVSLRFGDTVTAITMVTVGATDIQNPLTSASAGDSITYIYDADEDLWFPI